MAYNQNRAKGVLVQPEQSLTRSGGWFKLQNVIINQILHFNTFRACLIRLPHLPGVPHLHVNRPFRGDLYLGGGGGGS